MKKYYLETDELYPFHTIGDDPEVAMDPGDLGQIELSDEDYTDYKRVMSEFFIWQERLDEIYERHWEAQKLKLKEQDD